MFDFCISPEHWQINHLGVAYVAAFLWGLGSALASPCHLGIIPLLASHAAGIGPLENNGVLSPKSAFIDVLRFAIGYYLTIPLFGFLIACFGVSAFNSELMEIADYWSIPVGILLLWFAISMFKGHSCSNIQHVLHIMRKCFGLNEKSSIIAIGFGYGIVSSGCSIGFLIPLMLFSFSHGLIVSTIFASCFGIGHCIPMVAVGTSAPLISKMIEHDHKCHEDHHQEDDDHHLHCHHHEPHMLESILRKVLGVIMLLIGIFFIVHPFLEHHHH